MPYKDREKKRARDRAYNATLRAEHREEYNAIARRHAAQKRDYYRAYCRAWHKANPDYHREHAAQKRRELSAADWARVESHVVGRQDFMTQAEFDRAVQGVLDRHLGHKTRVRKKTPRP
jgi:hypothetical protein